MMYTDDEKREYAIKKAKKAFLKSPRMKRYNEKSLDQFLNVAFDLGLLHKYRRILQSKEYQKIYRSKLENKLRRSFLQKERYKNDPEYREKVLTRAREYKIRKSIGNNETI